ncbi:VQ motif-containing protein 25-like [Nicotiana tomentosiformis]|uniref:VQ motif-containing protein 25-like n=1 Tax=Nicotiana tomentosiformis TaxID=4098 RepID=UPI00388C59F7
MEAAGVMTQKQSYLSIKSPSSVLGMNKNSQTISKMKPKIRIIHIFAPEIIKTDVANFRELVQRLTGKPSEKKKNNNNSYNNIKKRQQITTKKKDDQQWRIVNKQLVPKKMELIRSGCNYPSEFRERIKGEEDIWRNANSGAGFLGGFQDYDGCFMQDFNLLPLDASAQLDAYGPVA